MLNISRSKGNQTMKFAQVIEYNNISIFFINYAEDKVKRLVPDLFCFFKKALYEVKAGGLQFSLNTSQLCTLANLKVLNTNLNTNLKLICKDFIFKH